MTAEALRAQLHYCPLTGMFTRKVDASNAKAGDPAGVRQPHGYVKMQVLGERHYAHRLAWLYVTGSWPAGRLDHRNGDRADNAFTNLREATQQQNQMNRPAKGARFHRGLRRWTAQIGVDRRQIYLGAFDSEQDAHAAYLAAAERYHGLEWMTRKTAAEGRA